jgi:hypothetical protein
MTGWKELLISILKIGASAPHEFTRQPRLSDCHARRIARSGHGADGLLTIRSGMSLLIYSGHDAAIHVPHGTSYPDCLL